MSLLICILLLSLIYIVWEDFQYRMISVWVLGIISIASIVWGISHSEWISLLKSAFINIAFLLGQLLVLSLYFSIKEKTWVNITQKYLGWGDIVFWIPLVFLFSPIWLISFHFISLLAVLLFFILFQISSKKENLTIPLAGGQALVLIGFMSWAWINETHFYNTPTFLF